MPLYFYGQDRKYGEFSNFYPCAFQLCAREVFNEEINSKMIDKTITVSSSEQAIMYMKAVLMNDSESALLIENANSPSESKRLGRNVTPFDDDKWKVWREDIAVYVLTKKFSSSEHLLSVLKNTHGQDIAEASANDRIWGIGIGIKQAMGGVKWRGKNILGRALVTVRDNLE